MDSPFFELILSSFSVKYNLFVLDESCSSTHHWKCPSMSIQTIAVIRVQDHGRQLEDWELDGYSVRFVFEQPTPARMSWANRWLEYRPRDRKVLGSRICRRHMENYH